MPQLQGVSRPHAAATATRLRGHRQGLPGVPRVPPADARALARGRQLRRCRRAAPHVFIPPPPPRPPPRRPPPPRGPPNPAVAPPLLVFNPPGAAALSRDQPPN